MICVLQVADGGRVIFGWFQQFCETHQFTADQLGSIRLRNPGLGQLEKEEVKRQRVFEEKFQQLADQLWKQNDCPSGGPILILNEAEKRHRDLLC